MTEADFQSKFTRWIKPRMKGSAVFELKICKAYALPFSAVKEHQLAALSAAKHDSVFYKIPDSGYDQKPFDCFMMGGTKAYVVIMWYTERGDDAFYMIDIDAFLKEKQNSKRLSLTQERAEEIGMEFHLNAVDERYRGDAISLHPDLVRLNA